MPFTQRLSQRPSVSLSLNSREASQSLKRAELSLSLASHDEAPVSNREKHVLTAKAWATPDRQPLFPGTETKKQQQQQKRNTTHSADDNNVLLNQRQAQRTLVLKDHISAADARIKLLDAEHHEVRAHMARSLGKQMATLDASLQSLLISARDEHRAAVHDVITGKRRTTKIQASFTQEDGDGGGEDDGSHKVPPLRLPLSLVPENAAGRANTTRGRLEQWASEPGVGAVEPDGLPVAKELKWVHKLVRFVEEVPIPGDGDLAPPGGVPMKTPPQARGEEAGAAVPAPPTTSAPSGKSKGPLQSRRLPGRSVGGPRSMFHRNVFPNESQKPQKSDAINLERWLSTMLEQLGVALPVAGSDVTLRERCESAMWLYELALGEVTRQVSLHSKVHAGLLGVVWAQYRKLIELHCGLSYEGDIHALLDQQEGLHSSMDRARDKLAHVNANLTKREIEHSESEQRASTLRDRLAMQIAHRGRDIESLKAAVREAESNHLGEMELRLNAERSVADLQEELRRRERETSSARALAETSANKTAELEEELARLRRELEAKNTLVEDGIASNASMQQRLTSAEVTLRDLRARMLEQVSLKEATFDEVSRRREEGERMQSQIELLLSRVSTLEGELDVERRGHGQLKDAHSSLSREKEATDKTLDELNGKHKKVTFRLDRTEETLVKERKDSKSFKVRTEELLARLTGEVKRHESNTELLEKSGAAERSKTMMYRQEVEEVATLLRPFRASLQGVPPPPDTEETRRKWEKLGRSGMPQGTIQLALKTVNELKTNLDELTREKETWRQRFDKADRERDMFEQRAIQFESKYEDMASENNKLQHELDSKGRKLDAEIAQRRQLVLDLDAAMMRATRAEADTKRMDELQVDFDTAKHKNVTLTNDLHSAQLSQENAERAKKHAVERAENAELMRDAVTSEIRAMRETMQNSLDEARHARERLEEVLNDLENKTNDIKMLQDEKLSLAKELEESTNTLELEIERLNRELLNMTGDKSLVTDKLAKVSHAFIVARYVLQGVAYDENFYERHDQSTFKDDASDEVVGQSARRMLEGDPILEKAGKALGPMLHGMKDGTSALQKTKISLLLKSNMILRARIEQMNKEHMASEKAWLDATPAHEREMYARLLDPVHADALTRTTNEVKELRKEVQTATDMSHEVFRRSTKVTAIAEFWQNKFDHREDANTQSGESGVETWLAYVQSAMPAEDAEIPEIAKSAKLRLQVARTIVKVYTNFMKRTGPSPLEDRAQGIDYYNAALRTDTVFDSIHMVILKGFGTPFEEAMHGEKTDAYAAESIGGSTTDEYARARIADFLAVCKEHQHDPKIATFSRFCSIMPGFLSESSYHFFTDILDMIRRSVEQPTDWEDLLEEWENGVGNVPIKICHVILANVYNEQDVGNLDVKIRKVFAPDRIRKGKIGDNCVDLDGLLAVLLKEFHENKVPRNPMAHPRMGLAARDTTASAPPIQSTKSLRRMSSQKGSVQRSVREGDDMQSQYSSYSAVRKFATDAGSAHSGTNSPGVAGSPRAQSPRAQSPPVGSPPPRMAQTEVDPPTFAGVQEED